MVKSKKSKICKRCGKKTKDLSQHGLCSQCSVALIYDATVQMKSKMGPVYEKWKEGTKKYIESG